LTSDNLWIFALGCMGHKKIVYFILLKGILKIKNFVGFFKGYVGHENFIGLSE